MTSATRTTVAAAIMFLAAGVATAQGLPEAPVTYDSDRLPAEFHRSRRAAIMEILPENGVAVFLSAAQRTRENDVSFEFRQSSDLYYLTGAHEPNSVLVLSRPGLMIDGRWTHEVLMVPPRNPGGEIWTGRLYGADRAQSQLGVEMAVSNERFDEIMGLALAGTELFHLPLPSGIESGSALGSQVAWLQANARILGADLSGFLPRILSMMVSTTETAFPRVQGMASRFAPQFAGTDVEGIVAAFAEAETYDDWVDWRGAYVDGVYADGTTLERALSQLRMTKTVEEVALMQRAIDNTTAAHREAMRSIEPGMYEYEVEALVEYVFRRNGSEYTGFPSIIGSGENSVILHYESNRRQMQAGDMVVMDIGAEYHGYSADVTRTVPVSGTFSPEQRVIYELVLRAQEAAIAATRAGNGFGEPGAAATAVLLEGMQDLGLVVEETDLRRFFMHGTSHYLGLYVHDVGTYGELTPGTVVTMEPGIYISPADDIDPKWWNIGVRIEDDVLVTDGDPVVMSAGAPRTVAEIEGLMAETGLGNSSAGVVMR